MFKGKQPLDFIHEVFFQFMKNTLKVYNFQIRCHILFYFIYVPTFPLNIYIIARCLKSSSHFKQFT